MKQPILGIDIGGTGIKGAVVDTESGLFVSERIKIATPSPATPDAVADVFLELVNRLEYEGPIGCGFPAIIKNGVAYTASNIDHQWIGTSARKLFESVSGQLVYVANDADLAGLGELSFGGGADGDFRKGTVLLITIGTGLGSALFYNGQLVPNTELGQLQLKKGILAEHYASNKIRKLENLSWIAWGKRLNLYLAELEKLLSPDVIILGGGGSKYYEEIKPFIDIPTKVVPATLGNGAGIVGAALLAKANG